MTNFTPQAPGGNSVANWILSTAFTPPSNGCLTLDHSIAPVAMDSDDPWYWDIDRVVAELCTESRSWSSDSVRSRRRPNFVTLEAALREQEIDGSTLLTAVDDGVLKNELGIKVLGQLAPVKQIIWDLRQESTRYRDWLGRYGSEISLASHIPYGFNSAPNIRKRSASPPPKNTALQVSSRISPVPRHVSGNNFSTTLNTEATEEQGSMNDQNSYTDAWIANSTGSKRRRLDTEADLASSSLQEDNVFGGNDELGPLDSQPVADNFLAQIDEETIAAIPGAEDVLLAEAEVPTKQCKRIAPTLVTSELDINRDRQIPTEADTVINHDPQNIEPGVIYLGDDGKKRLILMPQSGPDEDLPRRHQEQLRNQALADRAALHEGGQRGLEAAEQILESAKQDENAACVDALSAGYLGKGKSAVNDIFYSGTGIGKNLPLSEQEDEGLNLFTQGTVSDGRRRYVHGLMKRFLRSESKTIHRDGKSYSALCPYPIRLAPMHQSPSFTLLRKDGDGEVHATREIVSQWPELNSGTSVDVAGFQDYEDRQALFDLPDTLLLGGPNSYDNWDPDLLEKYRYIDGGDVVLPLYGDSDEDGEYDKETWKEIEEERGTLDRPLLPLKRTPLPHSEVNAAIDEGIAQIVIAWHDKKLPKLQRGAWHLWKKSRRKIEKRELIRKAKEHVDRINNHRLPQMRDEFLRDRWVSKKQVLRMTKNMELTIFDREYCLWQLSVMKSKQEPERPPPREPKPLVSNPPVFADVDDGECIMTDIETQSYDDDEDDFIDDAAESTDEAGHSRADDEADNLTMSDEASSDISVGGNETPTKVPRKAIKNYFKGRVNSEENLESEDELMKGMSPAVDEDEKIDSLQTDVSVSPRLPLRINPKKHKETQANTPSNPDHNVNTSQESAQAFIDLTILLSDTSAGEKSSGASQTINLITPEKQKNNLRLLFKREAPDAYASSDVMEVSHGEASDIPLDYLKLTDPAAIAKIPRRKWEEAGDTYRLLIGELFRIIPGRKEELSELFAQLTLTQMWSSMVDVMHAFRKGKDKVPGMDAKTYTGLTGVMRLFETYAVGRSRRSRKKLELTEIEMILEKESLFPQFHQICRKSFEPFLKRATEISDDDDKDPLPASRRKLRVSSGSASDSEEIEQDTPHKTRKRKVFENAQARDLRQQDQQRLAEQEERRRVLQDKLARNGSASTKGQKRIIINDAKHDDQGFVYVHEQISQRIKEHQIDGVRFMWSQIVTNGDVMQGCLLAHTMGLGKTMQVITLLVAIAEAAQSPDPSISSQIPPNLRESKTLILCPPGLIDNWMDELLIWAPPKILGEYRKFDSTLKAKDVRLDAIETWYNNGGVLIMSYDMFRKLIHNNSTQKTAAPLDEEEHAQVLEHLLRGPNIIIADEAHKMKNADASITQAAVQFRSSSRIALTGSPLANNVVEYHTMIEWIAPNYLGPITEFRAKYAEPIQQGSYSESTAWERRQGRKMLGVLREDLAPKVHRADISVLRKDLKPKTEFVITVPLTKLQHQAYSIYVRSMLGNDHELTKDGQVQLSTLWHWLAILSLLCNHPACFKAKLSERKDDAEKKIRRKLKSELAAPKASTSEDDDGPGDIAVWKVGVSEELVRQEMALFDKFGSAVEQFHSSNKVKLLLQILDASKAVGDKVLVFSQSIQTLNFLEDLCKSTRRKYARLDGSTKMSSRQGLTKDFNKGDTELYLISTTAGGIGLNLPGANRVIIFDFKFNPVNEEQAVGRAYRIGQQKPVFVYRFVAGGTFEESIHNTAVFKMQLASKVVDKKNPVAWAKKKTGDFLFEPKLVKQQDLSEFKTMDPFVLDKILDDQGQDSTIRAIVMTETFERHDHEVLTAEELQEVEQLVSDEKLKRSNKPAWDALVKKRAMEARPQQQTQQPPLNGSSRPPFQVAQYQGQHINGSTSLSERPPILPRMPPTLSQTLPANMSNLQSTSSPVTPEMTPVAGVNTKIRNNTPPSSPNSLKPLAHGAIVNGGAAVQETHPAKPLSAQQSKRVSLGKSSAPDHKRSLSGDQDGADAADRLLRVGIRQYSRSGGSVSISDNSYSEKLLDDLAISIRKEIERIDPKGLKQRVQEIIGLLAGNRELADSLVSGKLTAVAIVTMSSSKLSSMIGDTNGLGSPEAVDNHHASVERRRKLGQEVDAAILRTLNTVPGYTPNRHTIAATSMDLVKAIADDSKDLEAFEAAIKTVLNELSNPRSCLKLVSAGIKPKDFAKSLGLSTKSTKQPSSTVDGVSASPKSPQSPTRSIDSARDVHRSPQSKTNLAYFERLAARRRSHLPRWAEEELEKATADNLSRKPPPNTNSRAPSHEQNPIIDLT